MQIDEIVDKLLALEGSYIYDIEDILGYEWKPHRTDCRTNLIWVIQELLERSKNA